MALDYFIIDETPTQKNYIEANSGAAVILRWFSMFSAWVTPEFIDDYNNTVRYWRDTDRRSWFDTVVEPITTAIVRNTQGYAFNDQSNEYNDLSAYVMKSLAFKRYGWVFVPDNVMDPRSGEVVNPDDDNGGLIPWVDDDDELAEPVENPSILSAVASWALILGTGAATAYVTYKATSRFF